MALPATVCTVLVDAMNVMGGKPSYTSVARLAALLASFNGQSGCRGHPHALAFLPRQTYCGHLHRYFAQMDRDGWLFVVDGPPGADDVALITYSTAYAVPIITNDQFVDHIHAAQYNTRLVTDMLLVAADCITHTFSGAQWELFSDLGCEPVLRDAPYAGRYKTDPYRCWSHRRVLRQQRAAWGGSRVSPMGAVAGRPPEAGGRPLRPVRGCGTAAVALPDEVQQHLT